MIPLVVILTLFTMDVEVSAGLVCPAATTTDGPAVCFEPAAVLNFSQGWDAVLSIPTWKVSNYDPGDSSYPDYTEFEVGPLSWNEFYEESSFCYQIGVRKNFGFVNLQALAGMIDRTFERKYTGMDIDSPIYYTYESSDFTGSLSASIPTGNACFLAGGARYFDSSWSFSLSTGVSFSGLIRGSND